MLKKEFFALLLMAGAMGLTGCEGQSDIEIQPSSNDNQHEILTTRGEAYRSDSLALVALYRSTNGDEWSRNDGWLDPNNELKEWYGVRTAVIDGQERVISLRLGGNRLSGELPAELGNLTALQVFDLSDNYRLGGVIPEEFYNMKELRVWKMRFSNVHGSLSQKIGQLNQIDSLELWGAPWDMTQNGYKPKAEDTYLSGEIPAEIGQLNKASYIVLGRNNFTGEIPAEIGQLERLEYLDIARCQLSGNLPAELGQLKKLSTLFVSGNRLSGEIPAQMGEMTSLKEFYADENQLTGTIPSSFAQLPRLLRLSLADNRLSGEIPAVASQMEHLGLLYLDNNNFTGEIPSELGGKQQPLLVAVSLMNNNLTGNLPAKTPHDYHVDGKYYGVVYTSFYVSGNRLSGKIPSDYIIDGQLQENLLPQQAGYDLVK